MDVYITIVSLGELPSCAFSTGRRGEGGEEGGDYLVDLVRLGSRGFPQGWKWVAIVSDHLGRRRRRKFFGGCHLEKKNFTRNRKKRTSERREKKG